MSIFKRFKKLPVPEECKGFEVRTEKSICTGEKTIGFCDPKTGRLMYTELVKSDEDIKAFYRRYGIK